MKITMKKEKRMKLFFYYNLKLRVKSRKESYIGLTQENLMEFQVQSVYLIYT